MVFNYFKNLLGTPTDLRRQEGGLVYKLSQKT